MKCACIASLLTSLVSRDTLVLIHVFRALSFETLILFVFSSITGGYEAENLSADLLQSLFSEKEILWKLYRCHVRNPPSVVLFWGKKK